MATDVADMAEEQCYVGADVGNRNRRQFVVSIAPLFV